MSKRKIFAVLFPGNDWSRRHPNMSEDQRRGYEDFFDLARRAYNLLPVRVSKKWFRRTHFDRFWTWQNGAWQKIKRPIRPDIILDKTLFTYGDVQRKVAIGNQFLTVNPWELDMIASDKLLTNITFAPLTPPTFLIKKSADIPAALAKIQTKKIVLKPRLGFGGKGIQIMPRAQARKIQPHHLMLAQPLIATDQGIPGLYRGVHDFRIIFAGDKPMIAYIRTPAPGTLLCNISQGGGVIFVPTSKIPTALKPAWQYILDTLKIFPYKIFSVDFFFGKGRPYLVELNTKPIMYFPPAFKKEQTKMHHAYLRYLTSLL